MEGNSSLLWPFLKVSVDQFSQVSYIPISNQQSPINNPLGGGADLSLFSWKKPKVRRKPS
jgi:hypothetical protein